MSLKPNQSTITHIEVTFREVDRIYDLLPGTLLADTAAGKELVYSGALNLMISGSRFAWTGFLDEEGGAISGVKKLVSGVYRGVRVTGYAPFLQSFLRNRSTEIDQKYVYVWSADPSSGKPVELEYELYFEKGSFQKVPFDAAANQGKDTRQPAGERSQRLQLDALSFWKASHAREGYFFFLAPYQLPWAAIQDLNSTIAVRGTKLWDWFYTDIYTAADPETAKPISHDILKGNIPVKMMFRMHLVDPFKEGLNRSARLSAMLRRWEPEQQKLGKNREYLLALRVSDFAHSSSDLSENVDWWKLSETIDQYSREASQLLCLSTFRCAEVLRWIGEAHQPDVAALPGLETAANTWVVEGETAMGLTQSLPNDWHSPFSNAVDDYVHGPANIHQQVGKVVHRVHEDLELCSPGSVWLEENFEKVQRRGVGKGAAERPPLEEAHGGASILFPAKRKAFEGASEFNAGLLRFYAKAWVRKYRSETLSGVKTFLKEIHGIDIDLVKDGGLRWRLKERAGRQLRMYRKRPDRFPSQTIPDRVMVLDATHTVFPMVALAVEYVNLNNAWQEFREESHSLENQLELAGAVIDGYLAVRALAEKLPNPEIPLYRMGTRAIKFCPLAAASAAIDITTAGMDAAKARTADEGIAHGIRVVGASLCLAGTFTSETPPGWILAVAGLLLQAAGSYAAANLSAASRYLRYCEWGKGGSIVSGDIRDNQNEDWYRGKLSDLAKDLDAQFKALDSITYDYAPKIRAEGKDSKVVLYARMRDPEKAKSQTNLISPDARWNVRAELYREDSGGAPVKVVGIGSAFVPSGTAQATSSDVFDDLDLTAGQEYALHTFQWAVRTAQAPLPYDTIGPATDPPAKPWDEPDGSVRVKISAELDVFGDSKCIVKREMDDSVNLYLHTGL